MLNILMWIVIGWFGIGVMFVLAILIKAIEIGNKQKYSPFKVIRDSFKYDWLILLTFFLLGPFGIFSIKDLILAVQYSSDDKKSGKIKVIPKKQTINSEFESNDINNAIDVTSRLVNIINEDKADNFEIIEYPMHIYNNTVYYPRYKTRIDIGNHDQSDVKYLYEKLKEKYPTETVLLLGAVIRTVGDEIYFHVRHSVVGQSDFENAKITPIITTSVTKAVDILTNTYDVVSRDEDLTGNSLKNGKAIGAIKGDLKMQFDTINRFGKDKPNYGLFFVFAGKNWKYTSYSEHDEEDIIEFTTIPIMITRKKNITY